MLDLRRYVIIGNGIAGTGCAETLRKLDPHCQITLLAEEPYPLYNRVSLPPFLKLQAPESKVLMRLARWLPDRAERYRSVARETLKALVSDFLTVGGVVLHGSWGRMRHIEAGKPRQTLVDPLDQRIEVERVVEELANHSRRRRHSSPGSIEPVPLLQAAPAGGFRVLGIEREQNEMAEGVRSHLADRLFGHGVPVPHGHNHARVNRLPQLSLQRGRLLPGQFTERRLSPDARVVSSHLLRALGGEKARQRRPGQPGEGEVDDVGVGKQVAQEGFDVLKRVWPSQLKKHDAHRAVRMVIAVHWPPFADPGLLRPPLWQTGRYPGVEQACSSPASGPCAAWPG